jgi:hypothetical protein
MSSLRSSSNPARRDRVAELASKEATDPRRQQNGRNQELYTKERDSFRNVENSQTIAILDKQIGALEGDKVQLLKKLNTLLVEVDRLHQEKSDLLNQLQDERIRNEEYERKLKHSGKLKSVVDRNLQNDLKFEKDENQRLRNLLHQIEVERAELRSKLHDYEAGVEETTLENRELSNKLQQRLDHITFLESDNKAAIDKIQMLQLRLTEVEAHNNQLFQERAALKEHAAHLDGERADANMRITDEMARHDNFVIAMNNEKENMIWLHKRHSRLLASRSIALELNKIINRRLGQSLGVVITNLDLYDAKRKHCNRLWQIFSKVARNQSKIGLDIWARRLEWRDTYESRLNLVDKFRSANTKLKVFHEWRNLLLYRLHAKRRKVLAASKLFKLLAFKSTKRQANKFSRWVRALNHSHTKEDKLRSVIKHKYFTGLSRSFLNWKKFVARVNEEQAREDLATDHAANMLKQAVFSNFKTVTYRSRMKKVIETLQEHQADKLYQINVLNELNRYVRVKKAKSASMRRIIGRMKSKDLTAAMNKWRGHIQKGKDVNLKEKLVQTLNLRRDQVGMEKTFFAWKAFVSENKLRKAEGELAIEKPRRQELEEALDHVEQRFTTNSKTSAIRAVIKRFSNNVQSYFIRWRDQKDFFASSLPRVKHLMSHTYMKKLQSAFNRWKNTVIETNIIELCHNNEQIVSENRAFSEHISNLEQALQSKEEERAELASKLMKKTLNLIRNKEKSAALRTWARNALHEFNVESAGTRLDFKVNKILYQDGFYKILNYVIEKKKAMNRENRLATHLVSKWRNNLGVVFDSWLNYVRIVKNFRKTICKSKAKAYMFLKQKAFNSWHETMRDKREEIAFEAHSELQNLNTRLRKELRCENEARNKQEEMTLKLEKRLSKQAKRRVTNAFTKCVENTIFKYFITWRENIHLANTQLKETGKLQSIYTKQLLRRSWRTWNLFLKKKIEQISEETITFHVNEKKQMRRDMKELRSGLENQVKEKEGIIQETNMQVQKLDKLSDFLMKRTCKEMDCEFTENKAAWAFRHWQKRYYALKHSLSYVMSKTQQFALKRALKNIRQAAHENVKISSVRNMLINAFKNYSYRFVRNAFDTWHRNSSKKYTAEITMKLESEGDMLAEARQKEMQIKRLNRIKSLNVLTRQSKRKLFDAWTAAAFKSKAIRQAREAYDKKLMEMKMKSALQQLNIARIESAKKKKMSIIALGTSQKNLLSTMFNEWKYYHQVLRYTEQVFTSLGKKWRLDALRTSFCAVSTKSNLSAINATWTEKSRRASVASILNKLKNKLQFKAWGSWKDKAHIKSRNMHSQRNIFLHALHRKLRSGFDLWKESCKMQDVVAIAETDGPVAQEKNILKSRCDILTQLLQEEGINPKYVEEYILQKESLQSALLRKSVARMQLKAGKGRPDDSMILTRFFTIWKIWFIKRRQIVKYAARMMAYRKKGELMWAFHTWKRGFPLVANALKKHTRQELFGLVAKMDRDIKTLEGMVENNHMQVKYLESYSGILEQHTRRGQNQALTVCKMNIEKTLAAAMHKWIINTYLTRIQDLLSALRLNDEQIEYLKTQLQEIEEEKNALIDENMELRQASLDGIAIADAIETLTKERERLSVDLADKSATIRRLLQENTDLSSRLRLFEKEHEAMKSFTTTPPERDVPVRYESYSRDRY